MKQTIKNIFYAIFMVIPVMLVVGFAFMFYCISEIIKAEFKKNQ
jgi:uncharacterized protein YneF (UPF0154 family)